MEEKEDIQMREENPPLNAKSIISNKENLLLSQDSPISMESDESSEKNHNVINSDNQLQKRILKLIIFHY